MLRVKAFSNVPEELIEYRVNRWLKERQEKNRRCRCSECISITGWRICSIDYFL